MKRIMCLTGNHVFQYTGTEYEQDPGFTFFSNVVDKSNPNYYKCKFCGKDMQHKDIEEYEFPYLEAYGNCAFVVCILVALRGWGIL